jgi:hypothetical protein
MDCFSVLAVDFNHVVHVSWFIAECVTWRQFLFAFVLHGFSSFSFFFDWSWDVFIKCKEGLLLFFRELVDLIL